MHSYVTLLPFPLHHTLSFLFFLCLSVDALGFCGSLTPPRKQDSVSKHPISQIHSYADQLKYNAQIKLDHYYRKLLIFRIYHLIMKMGKTNTVFNVGISHCRVSSTLGSCSSFLFHLLLCLCKNCENKKKKTLEEPSGKPLIFCHNLLFSAKTEAKAISFTINILH